jgi:hypothetical protein
LTFFNTINEYVQDLVDRVTNEQGLIAEIGFVESLSPQDKKTYVDNAIFITAVNIKTRFLLMQKITKTYTAVSRASIMPGFTIVNSLSVAELSLSNPEVSERSARLTAYQQEATENIHAAVTQVSVISLPCYRQTPAKISTVSGRTATWFGGNSTC